MGDFVPLFLFLYYLLVMKVLSVLKSIIIENRGKHHRLFTAPEGPKFIATTHQTLDRKSNLTYEEIRDIILNAIDSGSNIHTRVGVPNIMLSRLIRDKYKKILYEFSKENTEEKKKIIPILDNSAVALLKNSNLKNIKIIFYNKGKLSKNFQSEAEGYLLEKGVKRDQFIIEIRN